jgi:subtilisin family serine protease
MAALERAVADGVQITNHSYGDVEHPGPVVKAAFDAAYRRGVLHVGAAGNSGNKSGLGENCLYPARFDTVIATAATTWTDARASFSSTCPEVEIAAPGYPVYSTWPGGGYAYNAGTSMSSPHVAGTAALVMAARPGWRNRRTRKQLQDTADDLGLPGRDAWYGYGMVDADEAAARSHPAPHVGLSYSCTELVCEFDATASFDPGGSIVDYEWEFGDGHTGSGVTASHRYLVPNVYTVVLTVTDDGGATVRRLQEVVVTDDGGG